MSLSKKSCTVLLLSVFCPNRCFIIFMLNRIQNVKKKTLKSLNLHWKFLIMLKSWMPVLLIQESSHELTAPWSLIHTESDEYHYHFIHQLNALNNLVGQQDAGDGVSVGQHGLVVQVLFPVATSEEAGWAGDVKHHHTAQRTFIIDPGHGYETLLAWRKDTNKSHCVIHLYINPSIVIILYLLYPTVAVWLFLYPTSAALSQKNPLEKIKKQKWTERSEKK